jgi:hypothetical protein
MPSPLCFHGVSRFYALFLFPGPRHAHNRERIISNRRHEGNFVLTTFLALYIFETYRIPVPKRCVYIFISRPGTYVVTRTLRHAYRKGLVR